MEPVLQAYEQFISQLSQFETVEVVCQSEATASFLQQKFLGKQVSTHVIPTDRSWLRDSGPVFIFDNGNPYWLNSTFNAWALYEDYLRDNALPEAIAKITDIPQRKTLYQSREVVLEGGMFDGNGCGSLLVTRECLLSDKQIRNPGFNQKTYEALFEQYFGVTSCIWLEAGIVGDDTHGHVDDVARFVRPNTIVCAFESKRTDANFDVLEENFRLLRSARDSQGQLFEVVRLPMPEAIELSGQRYPASYANFYIANNSVFVPVFNDPQDEVALRILEELLPEKSIYGISCREWVIGQGTLHCSTQQQVAV